MSHTMSLPGESKVALRPLAGRPLGLAFLGCGAIAIRHSQTLRALGVGASCFYASRNPLAPWSSPPPRRRGCLGRLPGRAQRSADRGGRDHQSAGLSPRSHARSAGSGQARHRREAGLPSRRGQYTQARRSVDDGSPGVGRGKLRLQADRPAAATRGDLGRTGRNPLCPGQCDQTAVDPRLARRCHARRGRRAVRGRCALAGPDGPLGSPGGVGAGIPPRGTGPGRSGACWWCSSTKKAASARCCTRGRLRRCSAVSGSRRSLVPVAR